MTTWTTTGSTGHDAVHTADIPNQRVLEDRTLQNRSKDGVSGSLDSLAFAADLYEHRTGLPKSNHTPTATNGIYVSQQPKLYQPHGPRSLVLDVQAPQIYATLDYDASHALIAQNSRLPSDPPADQLNNDRIYASEDHLQAEENASPMKVVQAQTVHSYEDDGISPNESVSASEDCRLGS